MKGLPQLSAFAVKQTFTPFSWTTDLGRFMSGSPSIDNVFSAALRMFCAATRTCDIAQEKSIFPRAMVMLRKTRRPLQFEIAGQARQSVVARLEKAQLLSSQYLSSSRVAKSPHLSSRQHARIVAYRAKSIGSNTARDETHTMHPTKTTLIDRRTKNPRAITLLLGPIKLESSVSHPGIEVDDAFEMAEQTKVQPVAGMSRGVQQGIHQPLA